MSHRPHRDRRARGNPEQLRGAFRRLLTTAPDTSTFTAWIEQALEAATADHTDPSLPSTVQRFADELRSAAAGDPDLADTFDQLREQAAAAWNEKDQP